MAKKDERGRYVDEDGNVIEDEHGRVDESDVVWLSNEGFRISTIMTQLREEPELKANPLIEVLFSPAYADSRQAAPLSRPALDVHLTSPVIRPAVAAPVPVQPISISNQRRRGHTGCHNVDDPDVPYSAERGAMEVKQRARVKPSWRS